MLKKKAQGLSITTIIVAVIGLIILVVIVMMITDKLGIFSEGVGRAASCDTLCRASGYGAEGDNLHPELKGSDNTACKCEK